MQYFDAFYSCIFYWKDGEWLNHNPKISITIYNKDSVKKLKLGYADYSILGKVIVYNQALDQLETAVPYVEGIKESLKKYGKVVLSNPAIELRMTSTHCEIIDLFHTKYKTLEQGVNWNTITPKGLQTIPTSDIIELLDDWILFLKTLAEDPWILPEPVTCNPRKKEVKMNYLDYKFSSSYGWKSGKWADTESHYIARVNPVWDIIRVAGEGCVVYDILNSFFYDRKELRKVDTSIQYIHGIRKELEEKGEVVIVTDMVLLKINKEYVEILDMLCDPTGKEAPMCWEILTPEPFRRIPTKELFQMLEDWVEFLRALERGGPRLKVVTVTK